MFKLLRYELLLFLGLILVLNSALCVGISPSRVELNFVPGGQDTIQFQVFNSELRIVNVELYTKGDLSNFITIDKNTATIGPSGSKTFTATISYPGSITPGMHDNRIGAVESMGQEGGNIVGSRTGVEMQVYIYEKYPGKFLSPSLLVENVNLGQTVSFQLNLVSRGSEMINSIKSSIKIYDSSNNFVKELPIKEISLAPGESQALDAVWDKPSAPGEYTARAVIDYDGTNSSTDVGFRVGELSVDILNVTASDIKTDSIGKFAVQLRSNWGGNINNVVAAISFGNKNLTSQQTSIAPWDEKTVTVYWDPVDYKDGTYPAVLTVYYDGHETSRQFDVVVKNGSNTLYIALAVAGGALLIAIIIFALTKLTMTKATGTRKK